MIKDFLIPLLLLYRHLRSANLELFWPSIYLSRPPYLELDIPLTRHKRSMPRHLALVRRQPRVKLSMRRPVDIIPLALPILFPLIRVKESKNTQN